MLLCLVFVSGCQSRVALVVGNSSYSGSLQPLNTPVNDAKHIGKALERLGFVVFYGLDSNRPVLTAVIENFIKESQFADIALFYYAGHGFQDGGENYVVPAHGDLDTDAIPIKNLYEALSETSAEIILVLDSCRTARAADHYGQSSPQLGVSMGGVMRRGMAEMNVGAGTLVSFATAPGRLAYDGGSSEHSVFTGALLSHIETPNVEINVMLRNVRGDVIARSDGEQVPAVQSLLHRPFYLKRDSTFLSW